LLPRRPILTAHRLFEFSPKKVVGDLVSDHRLKLGRREQRQRRAGNQENCASVQSDKGLGQVYDFDIEHLVPFVIDQHRRHRAELLDFSTRGFESALRRQGSSCGFAGLPGDRNGSQRAQRRVRIHRR